MLYESELEVLIKRSHKTPVKYAKAAIGHSEQVAWMGIGVKHASLQKHREVRIHRDGAKLRHIATSALLQSLSINPFCAQNPSSATFDDGGRCAHDASQWSLYMSGVFDSCAKEPVVDHAVLLVGYGIDTPTGLAFWKIRNSWGYDFGEQGFLRLRRHAPLGDEPCGWDYDPQKGNGCKGGPSKIWVCGECGVLSDVVYPVGTKVMAMS